MNMEIGENSF